MSYKIGLMIVLFINIFNFKLFGYALDYFVMSCFVLYFLVKLSLPNYDRKFMLLFLFFVIGVNFSVFFSKDLVSALSYSVRFVPLVFFYLALSALKESEFNDLIKFFIYATFLLSLISLYHVFIGSYTYYGRFLFSVFGEAGDPNFTAYHLLIASFSSIYLSKNNRFMYFLLRNWVNYKCQVYFQIVREFHLPGCRFHRARMLGMTTTRNNTWLVKAARLMTSLYKN